ncbi:MAG: hypothetical protein C5S38_09000 [Candidatus Methanophagaceae archaeon]|nr:MAG: hypothetical protein C5S38_09000 [Methanophagales archaeon]KAF5430280.1 Ribosomal protein S27E [Methanophagales archaeon]
MKYETSYRDELYNGFRVHHEQETAERDDEKSGAVFTWRRKGEEEFNYKLKCPYCSKEQESSVVFKKRLYRVKCSNCGKSIMVEKRGKK